MSEPPRISRLIRKQDLENILPWDAPNVLGSQAAAARRERQPEMLTAHQIEQIQQQAHKEGFERGRREGHEDGLGEMRQRGARLEALLEMLARPLVQLDEQVEHELVQLAIAIGQQLVRRELKTSPGEIVAVVRDCIALLPVAARGVRLYLHPQDAALVREALAPSGGERAWSVVEDPVITPGGCRVITDTSRIDATVESRLTAVIADLLGGQREDDRAEPDS